MLRRNPRRRRQNPYPPTSSYRSPDKQVEPSTTTISKMSLNNHQDGQEDYRIERRKIVALLKNWHVRVQNNLGFDATLEVVKQKWTRFLDIDLLMDLEELEEAAAASRQRAGNSETTVAQHQHQQTPLTSAVNEMFKDVVAFLEARQPCGAKGALSESEHNYCQGQKTELTTKGNSNINNNNNSLRLPPPAAVAATSNQSIPLSESVTKQLQETHQRLHGYFEGSINRLSRGKCVDRRKVFVSANSFIATATVMGRVNTDIDLVDRLLKALAPPITPSELLFIDRQLSILSQHLKESEPALVAPITPTDVKWERCYTQQGRPMIQVDGYLFYVCPRRKKVGKKASRKVANGSKNNEGETVNYFRCITNRKGAPKCPVSIKFNCRNEIVFRKDRQHSHPPVDITRYLEKADRRKQEEQEEEVIPSSSDQSSSQ